MHVSCTPRVTASVTILRRASICGSHTISIVSADGVTQPFLRVAGHVECPLDVEHAVDVGRCGDRIRPRVRYLSQYTFRYHVNPSDTAYIFLVEAPSPLPIPTPFPPPSRPHDPSLLPLLPHNFFSVSFMCVTEDGQRKTVRGYEGDTLSSTLGKARLLTASNAVKSERSVNDVDVHVILSQQWAGMLPSPCENEAKGLRRVVASDDLKETSRLGNFITIRKEHEGYVLRTIYNTSNLIQSHRFMRTSDV